MQEGKDFEKMGRKQKPPRVIEGLKYLDSETTLLDCFY